MYQGFYGFLEKPFNITPDPKYLYLSAQHQEAISHLLYGIQERGGFIVITGEVGTGKTILCRYLLRQLDDRTEGAVILNPSLSELELLKAINEDFGIHSIGTTKKDLLDELNAFLLERRAMGFNMVLVIDEAQNLAPALLEQIRLLSNLETETEKLIQIILLGQPELRDLLARPDLRQLTQRITARYHLGPLSTREVGAYIQHRMGVAGNAEAVHFSRGILRRIFAFSRGTPRLINVVCDRALLGGFAANSRQMTRGLVKQAIREITGTAHRPPLWKSPYLTRAAAVAAVAVGCVALGWAANGWYLPGNNPRPQAPAAALPEAPAAGIPAEAQATLASAPPPAPISLAPRPALASPPTAAPASPRPAEVTGAPVRTVAPAEEPRLNLALATAPMAPALELLPTTMTPAPPLVPAASKPVAPIQPIPAAAAPPRLEVTKPHSLPTRPVPVTPMASVAPPSEAAETRRLISSLFEPSESRVRNRAPAVIKAALMRQKLRPSLGKFPPAPAPLPRPLPTADLRLQTASAVAHLVESLQPFDSRLDAAQALFSLWGRDFRPPKEANDPDITDYYKLALNQGMRCSELWANFDTLQQINLPGILEVFSPGAPASRYVVLAAVHGDGTGTILWGPTAAARVDLAALDECWRRRAFLFWQESEPFGEEILRDGDAGDAVQWVQASLEELGYLTHGITDVYDPETRQAVIRFQKAYHLLPDGVVGPRTRMVIYSRLLQYPTPNLTPMRETPREHYSRRTAETAG